MSATILHGEPKRPVLRYHGGKWKLAPWIISHFPPHRIYTEAFGGGASVLLRKSRAYGEIYNDLDGEVVTLFRVLRESGDELVRRLRLTPFARAEFDLSYERSADPVEQARRTVVRSFMGFGSDSASGIKSGFRANSNRSGTTPAHDWASYPDKLAAAIDRLRGVVIENRDATTLIPAHDAPDTLHYVDPPYPHATRTVAGKGYRHEMTDDDHRALAEVLHRVEGMVVLSGYPCDLYDVELYPDWHRVTRAAHADGARKRTEVLWLNPAAAKGTKKQPDIFAMVPA
jgi:DNA adenine methylase